MPKITIKEEDYTGSGNSITLNQTVLIPGLAGAYYRDDPSDARTQHDIKENDEFEFRGASDEFEKIVNGDPDRKSLVSEDLGYNIAKLLLDIGMTVLYVVVDSYRGDTTTSGVTTEGTTQSATWWNKFKDKSVYELRFITTGKDDSAIANLYAAGVAEDRGDAVALMYIPRDIAKDYTKAFNYVNGVPVDVNVYKDVTVTLKDDDGHDLYYAVPVPGTEGYNYLPYTKVIQEVTGVTEVASLSLNNGLAKYAAGFVPNFSIVQTDGTELALPGYVAYLGCFGTYVGRFASWFAMAGATRGLIPWPVKFDANFGELAINKLQNRDSAGVRALNPICNIRNYGDLVWGNRTLYPVTKADGSTVAGLTASSFLNIRMLVSDIKNHLYNISRGYTFDPNSSLLWTRFYNSVVPLLEDMKTNQGIKGYKLTQVKDTKKATLRAILRIVPIEAVEDFIFNIELADSIEVTEE